MTGIRFAPFVPSDAAAIRLQPSQWTQAGIDARDMAPDVAAELATGNAWTATDHGGCVLACGGLIEVYENAQATAWAMIAEAVSIREMAIITRFGRTLIANARWPRIECMVEDRSQAIRWAQRLGLRHEGTHPRWGPRNVTVHTLGRVR